MTQEEKKVFDAVKSQGFSEETEMKASEVSTRGLGMNLLADGDIITLPNTENPTLFKREIKDGNTVNTAHCIMVQKNGSPFAFYFQQLGRQVLEYDDDTPKKDAKGNTVIRQSDTKVSNDYRNSNTLAAFMKVYKGAKIKVLGSEQVHTVIDPQGRRNGPTPREQRIYKFEV